MAGWQDAPIVGGGNPQRPRWQDAPVASLPPGASSTQPEPYAPVVNPEPQMPETYGESYAGQGVSGFNEGLADLLGMPATLANDFLVRPAMAGINAVAGTDFKPSEKPFLGQGFMRDLMAPTIAPPTDDPGKQFARRIGTEFGGAAIPVGAVATRAARPLQMLAAELAMTAGSGAGAGIMEQAFPGNPMAEMAGQVLGAGTVSGATGAARRAITPFPTSPERIRAAESLAREGVDLTAGQRTGSQNLRYAESELGGRTAENMMERQAEQFTSAALRRAGINANRATPEVIDGAFTRIGGEFEDIGRRNTIVADRQMLDDLRTAWTDYANNTAENDRIPAIENFITDIARAVQNNGGRLAGTVYTSLRSRLGELARNAASNPERRDALYGIQHALDDAMERNMSQDDIDAFRNARREYRNILVLEKAATSAGENAAQGLISPAALRQATVSTHGRRNYARGDGEFADLARSGAATMSPLPNSGTPGRTAARNLGTALPTVLGAAAGAPGGILGSMAGAAVGAAVPAVTGRAILSNPGRAYLANQLLAGAPSGDPRGIGPIAGMLMGQNGEPDRLEDRKRRMIQQLLGAP